MSEAISRVAQRPVAQIDPRLLAKLASPTSFAALQQAGDRLITIDGRTEYRLSETGIPFFAEEHCSAEAARQRDHYQKVAEKYVENLGYPHTQEYMAYLDRVFMDHVVESDFTEALEICCGRGELLELSQDRLGLGIGIDISPRMLEAARQRHAKNSNFLFVQGDATQLPVASGSFNSAFMFGGIHHVTDRKRLFEEVFRILKPGGRFYFREPVSDFILWRWIRAVIYRLSPALDSETERPLLWRETVPVLERAGFRVRSWDTYGFLGFCLFMNSDVLVLNRLFRFIPGIRPLTRLSTHFDELTRKVPGLSRSGLQVVGVAEKPVQA